MIDESGTAPAEGGESSESTNEVVNSIPTDWAENDSYKDYFGDDGKFDFEKFGTDYASAKESMNNQPVVPETPEDYSFEFPQTEENEPTYLIDEADYHLQRAMAKEAGMTQAQFETMIKFDMARGAKMLDDVAKGSQEAKSELMKDKDWNTESKFQANMAAAANVALNVFGKEFAERHDDIGNDLQLLKGLYLLSTKLSEDTLKSGSGVESDPRKTGVDGEKMFIYKNS